MATVITIGLVLISLALIGLVIYEAFETMLLPRRVTRAFRFTRYFYVCTWQPWKTIAIRIPAGRRRQTFLSLFGPVSIVVLFGVWAVGLIVGFAVLHAAIGTPLHVTNDLHTSLEYFYMSGVTFFTLGFGDVTPSEPLGRMIAVVEAGLGFGFLAAVIGYLPVLYGAFSKREASISLLDARAGSPPTASQILIRIAPARHLGPLTKFLEEWERWASELLESHLSFPVLSYYRSQHDNQSWLAGLTAILDTCSVLIARVEEVDPYQAQLTFAMARHAVVDLSQVFGRPPDGLSLTRLGDTAQRALTQSLRSAGLNVRDDERADLKLAELQAMYEPFLQALSSYLLFPMPPLVTDGAVVDNWQTSAWMRRTAGIGDLTLPINDDHDA